MKLEKLQNDINIFKRMKINMKKYDYILLYRRVLAYRHLMTIPLFPNETLNA